MRDQNLFIVNYMGVLGQAPSKEVPEKDRILLDRCLQMLGITEHEQKYDIHCPSLVNSLFPSDSSELASPIWGR